MTPAESEAERRSRHDCALIEAAVAVNGAADVDEALAVLADTARTLLEADRVSIVVWDLGRQQGVIRAESGAGASARPKHVVIGPGSNEPYRAACSGKPFVSRATHVGGVGKDRGATIAALACRISVPLLIDDLPRTTFQAGWRQSPTEAEIDGAVSTLELLGRLTRIAYRAEHERERSQERARFDTVLDAVGDGVIVMTEEGRVANRAARDLLGVIDGPLGPPEAFAARSIEGEELSIEDMPGARAWRTGEVCRMMLRLTSLTGEEVVVDSCATPIRGEDGVVVGSVSSFRDVTEDFQRDLVAARLRQQLFDTMPTAVSIVDSETKAIVSANAAYLELIGYEADEVIGTVSPSAWWESPADFEACEWQPTDRPFRFETRFRRKDGTVVPVELLRFWVHDDRGRKAASVALITDLTERRRFEQHLLQSGKLAAIGQLAAGVAHEINNPLFAILGLAEFALQEVEAGSKPHERLELIHRTGIEIKEIVRALLDFAREPAGETATVSLVELAAQTTELLRRTSLSKSVELVERYASTGCLVEGSPNQLKQIFLNLLSNAQQAMPGAGTITFDVFEEPGWVVAEVSDTGGGIAADTQAYVFDPFFTTKREQGGTGLGLAISLKIANVHGGDLLVRSEPGAGAVFTLRLPRVGR